MQQSTGLRRRFAFSAVALFIAFFAAVAATFAWYIYNTSAHITRLRMVAGTSAYLYISNENTPDFVTLTTPLNAFEGRLNPVSTDRIQNGFQKVFGFTNGAENQPTLVANLFGGAVESADYYKTSIWLRTDGADMPVYLADINFTDNDPDNPISTAIRVGFVQPDSGVERIFSINEEPNPRAEYNTQKGAPGDVLDSTKTDGSTVTFTPYTHANFAAADPALDGGTEPEPGTGTGTGAQIGTDPVQLCTATSAPVQLDVYIWLEGCDEDCTQSLSSKTLQDLALAFSGGAG